MCLIIRVGETTGSRIQATPLCLEGIPFAGGPEKQRVTATSTVEAEYLALSAATKQLQWLQHFVSFELIMTVTMAMSPLCMEINEGSVSLIKNPIVSDRTKHIDVVYHHVRNLHKRQQFNLERVTTTDNPADICTKALPATRLFGHPAQCYHELVSLLCQRSSTHYASTRQLAKVTLVNLETLSWR